MEIFASIILIIILIAIQHFLNWMWREAPWESDQDAFSGMAFLTTVAIIVTMLCGYYLIKWMYPVII